MNTQKKTNKQLITNFLSRLINKLEEGKPFTISFNKEKGKVTKDNISILNQELKQRNHTGGFLPFLSMIPTLFGNIVKSLSGQGIDYGFTENGEEKEGGILPALGALLPLALKGIPLLLGGIGAASSIAHTVNQKKHNDEIEKIARGKGFYLNPHQGKGVKDFLKEVVNTTEDIEDNVKTQLKNVLKSFKNGVNIKINDNKLIFSSKNE